MSEIKLFNTLTRKKEVFKPIEPNYVGMYNCGPTMYWYQHIGNLRYFLFADALKRVLLYNNYKVKQVINITDVGHMTSDEDAGEDKIEKAAKKEHKTPQEIVNFYLKIFLNDLNKLNISEPDIWCKATEHIKEQIELIKKLEEKGYTYKTSVGVIFDTSKFKNYGKFARLNLKDLKYGDRVEVDPERKNPSDFALWITNQPNHLMKWSSPWGIGFPGWHIECSAMSMKYLGEQFDIHTGGQEHIPVHHTNEIAQSEAATGKKFVNYWLHIRWLLFTGEKMSKSKGNLYTISALEEKGFSPLDFRYLFLTAHYRTQQNFTWENLKNAQNSYERLKNIISEIKDDGKTNKEYLEEFEKCINNDLDMPNALKVLWKIVREENALGKLGTIKKMDEVFGLDLLKKEKHDVPDEILKLVHEREKARKNKNFKLSDELREKINKKGWQVADTPDGMKVRKD